MFLAPCCVQENGSYAFPAESLLDLLATAGQFVGVSTQRKNGYGRFSIGEVLCHKLDS